jgi:mRNA-degrading endonuclease RelE of RelBE toxin-antitoxin system
MCYEIVVTPRFEKDLEYYEKKRKFKHIEDDIDDEIQKIEEGTLVGEPIDDIHLENGKDVYKARAVNSDTRMGKSNGYRIIYYAIKNEKIAYLLTVYYKKDNNKIPSKKQISDLIKQYCFDDRT